MSSVQYENQIIDAIETIVQDAVDNAGYDKTIQGVIIECEDASIGKYKIQCENNYFEAYSQDIDTLYSIGQLVNVSVPNNDMSQIKTIIKAVDKNYIEQNAVYETKDYYASLGNNILNYSNVFSLCSYKSEDSVILYDKDLSINEISFDETAFSLNLEKSNIITFGADFKTKLNGEQQAKGNYGICLEVKFRSNADASNIITKKYVLDINSMEGMPYRFINYNRRVKFCEINKDNYVEISKIYLFSKDFPNTIGSAPYPDDDIFIKNIELYISEELTEDQLNGYYLNLVSLKPYFTNEDTSTSTIQIKGVLKYKNKDVQTLNNIKYYWFVENTLIDSASNGYVSYGGNGWECLNDYNILEELTGDQENREYVSADTTFIVTKSICDNFNNRFKLVAVLNNGTVVDNIINIKNYDATYEFTISSSEGTEFFYDNGSPTLTLLDNGSEMSGSGITYQWSQLDNNGIYTLLEETEIIPDQQSVSGNKIYNLDISQIEEKTTYYCSVFIEGNLKGTAAIDIYNILENRGGYFLNIINGGKTYNYTRDGISPKNGSLETPITISPITFTIVDEEGHELPEASLRDCEIEWIYPISNSMLENFSLSADSLYLTYSIANLYNIKKINNNRIKLNVSYKGKLMHAETEFNFVKDGEPGTNGTDIVCRIVPNISDPSSLNDYPMLINGVPNFTPATANKWFKVEVWQNGEKLFSGTDSGNGFTITWKMLVNKYKTDGTATDPTSVTISGSSFTYGQYRSDAANIIKAEIVYGGNTYFATLPLITVNLSNINYNIALEKDTGFRYVMYGSDGENPSYNNVSPFTIKLTQGTIDLSTETNTSYTWDVKGRVYTNNTTWTAEDNLTEKTDSLLAKNQKRYIPVNKYSGENVENALEVEVKISNNTIGKIHIPIHLYLDRFGMRLLNQWDGNKITINNEAGAILTPQIGAGKKDTNNTFTGLVMGTAKEANSTTEKIGLLGYKQGVQTLFLDSQTGRAEFGKAGGGQIILDPANNTAKIQSGNYTAGSSGMLIDLTTPEIKFGSGKFSVNSSGVATMTGANISAANITQGTINSASISQGTIDAATITQGTITNANIKSSITVGGSNNTNGTITVKNSSGNDIVLINQNGITLNGGATVVGSNGLPTVLIFDTDYTIIGYDRFGYSSTYKIGNTEYYGRMGLKIPYKIPTNFIIKKAYICYTDYCVQWKNSASVSYYGYQHALKPYFLSTNNNDNFSVLLDLTGDLPTLAMTDDNLYSIATNITWSDTTGQINWTSANGFNAGGEKRVRNGQTANLATWFSTNRSGLILLLPSADIAATEAKKVDVDKNTSYGSGLIYIEGYYSEN